MKELSPLEKLDAVLKALEKHHSGASIVQLYTGLIYKGPQLIKDSIVALQKP